MTPRSDGLLVARAGGEIDRFALANPHPEVSWHTLFGKVWYEGYAKPEYVWQSTGATDDFEPKFSLVPLIFGTIKGTFYALLFAIPLAVLGALYTSQFVHPTIRARIKPTVEIMAALPSVVIGFVAGLYLAPVVERNLVGVVADDGAAAALRHLRRSRLAPAAATRCRGGSRSGSGAAASSCRCCCSARWLAFAIGAVRRGWPVRRRRAAVAARQRSASPTTSATASWSAWRWALRSFPIIFTISEDAFSSVPVEPDGGVAGARRQPLADGRPRRPADGEPGHLFGDHGRLRPRRRRDDDRADGDRQHAGAWTGRSSTASGRCRRTSPSRFPRRRTAARCIACCSWPAALLFVMTFTVNTIAEVVRQRLRERYKAV